VARPLVDSIVWTHPDGTGSVHRDTVVGIAREFVQSSRGGAVYVRVATTTQKADDGGDNAFLAERRSVVSVPAADSDGFSRVMTQQLIRLTAVIHLVPLN